MRDDAVASPMDVLDVCPPLQRITRRLSFLPDAELAQVFEHNLTALQLRIGGLNGTVLAATIAIIGEVVTVTAGALPENVAWLEL